MTLFIIILKSSLFRKQKKLTIFFLDSSTCVPFMHYEYNFTTFYKTKDTKTALTKKKQSHVLHYFSIF